MELAIGVLAVGSLYWDTRPTRQEWRQSRLNTVGQFDVKVPIRYGRRSGTGTEPKRFTMVFSRECLRRRLLRNKLGRAKVIPCIRPVRSVENLITEASLLWDAELKRQAGGARLSPDGDNWGCVGLLCNPNSKIPQHLLDGWAERVGNEPHYGNFTYSPNESAVISGAGLLQIPWPALTRCRRRLPLDLLLATPTNPTLEGHPLNYPTAKTIAALSNQSPKSFEYFKNDRTDHIYTFQDRQIMRHLTPKLRDAVWQARRTS